MSIDFRTILPLPQTNLNLSYEHHFFTFGSCFAENMSQFLNYFQFKQLSNPFGIIYNTYSIAKIIQRIISQQYFLIEDCFENQGLWSSFEVHSKLNQPNREDFLKNLNHQLKTTHDFLKKADVFLLTLGTSWVYEHIEKQEIVANCQKFPSNQFRKKMLSAEENEKHLNQCINYLLAFNPKIKIILTLSPVRHIKDGFAENNWSKANLIQAIHHLKNPQVYYFPSYEIMMDELRDYRFYAEDMLHPNDVAKKYIWQKFVETYFLTETQNDMKKVTQIQNMKAHRPLETNNENFKMFNKNLKAKIDDIQKQFPWMFNW